MTGRLSPILRRGDVGPHVAAVCQSLVRTGDLDAAHGLPADPGLAPFDDRVEEAVRAFQQRRGLVADGIVGGATRAMLDGAGLRLGERELGVDDAAGPFAEGDDVIALQERLVTLGFRPGKVDGVYGPRTGAAVMAFQLASGLDGDGRVGGETLAALGRLARAVSGGSADELRERELMRRSGPELSGRVVVIDPGHGVADQGFVSPSGLAEAELVMDLARRIETRLAAYDVRVVFTRDEHSDGGTDDDRAAFANAHEAHFALSLHCDHTQTPSARGFSTYYYGDPSRQVSSRAGARLADLIQREVVARTGLVDCRSHPRTWQLLRRTQMPTVRVDLGYLSHEDEAAALADPRTRDRIAEGIVVALQRLVLGERDPADTGRLDLSELRRSLRASAGSSGLEG